MAAQEGHVLISHVLVQAGGELDAIDDEQNTPLMLACIKGKANIVRYLLQAGADLTLRGDDGMTCLHLAAQNGHLECVHIILGQNNLPRKFINLQDEGGWTPLVWACENKHEEVIRYLCIFSKCVVSFEFSNMYFSDISVIFWKTVLIPLYQMPKVTLHCIGPLCLDRTKLVNYL